MPIARRVDRGIRRNIIALVMAALSGAVQSFWHLFVARVFAIDDLNYVPIERRSGVFAIYQFGLFAGMALGMALVGWLGSNDRLAMDVCGARA